jgi:hypothetical protein
MSDERPNTDLELAFGVEELSLRTLSKAGEAFHGLLREVARSYLDTSGEPARWLVHVEAGSVLLPVRSEPLSADVAPSKLHEVAAVVAEGLATLEDSASRPQYFSDRALEHASNLAKLASAELPITVRNGKASASLSVQLVAHVEKVLGPDEEAIGTIEGALEALNIHGTANQFQVWDARTGKSVTCHMTSTVALGDLLPAVGHRVSVRGRVRSRPDGSPVSIRAEKLTVFPSDQDLPGADETRGLLRDFEVDE